MEAALVPSVEMQVGSGSRRQQLQALLQIPLIAATSDAIRSKLSLAAALIDQIGNETCPAGLMRSA
jgi:hypothetical protein